MCRVKNWSWCGLKIKWINKTTILIQIRKSIRIKSNIFYSLILQLCLLGDNSMFGEAEIFKKTKRITMARVASWTCDIYYISKKVFSEINLMNSNFLVNLLHSYWFVKCIEHFSIRMSGDLNWLLQELLRLKNSRK